MPKCQVTKCKRRVLAPASYCHAHYANPRRRAPTTRVDEGWDNGLLTKLLYSPEDLRERAMNKWFDDLVAIVEGL